MHRAPDLFVYSDSGGYAAASEKEQAKLTQHD